MSTLDELWWEQAACRRMDPEQFTTPVGRYTDMARAAAVTVARGAIATCNGCPVKDACHAEADDPATPRPVGVIRAGIAYDNDGQPHRDCGHCGQPVLAREAGARFCGGKVCAQLGILAAHRARTRKAAA